MRKKLLRYGQTLGQIASYLVLAAAAIMLLVGFAGFMVKVASAFGADVGISGLPVASVSVSATPGSIDKVTIKA